MARPASRALLFGGWTLGSLVLPATAGAIAMTDTYPREVAVAGTGEGPQQGSLVAGGRVGC